MGGGIVGLDSALAVVVTLIIISCRLVDTCDDDGDCVAIGNWWYGVKNQTTEAVGPISVKGSRDMTFVPFRRTTKVYISYQPTSIHLSLSISYK